MFVNVYAVLLKTAVWRIGLFTYSLSEFFMEKHFNPICRRRYIVRPAPKAYPAMPLPNDKLMHNHIELSKACRAFISVYLWPSVVKLVVKVL